MFTDGMKCYKRGLSGKARERYNKNWDRIDWKKTKRKIVKSIDISKTFDMLEFN